MYLYGLVLLVVGNLPTLVYLVFVAITKAQNKILLLGVGSLVYVIFIVIYSIVFFVLLGIYTNKYYLKFVDKKINEIEKTCMGDEHLMESQITKKGGTSITALLGMWVITLVISVSCRVATSIILPLEKPEVMANNIKMDLDKYAKEKGDTIPQTEGNYTCTRKNYFDDWKLSDGEYTSIYSVMKRQRVC